jgi:uncharacterized protein YutE (UPF0331/DUF86 family)
MEKNYLYDLTGRLVVKQKGQDNQVYDDAIECIKEKDVVIEKWQKEYSRLIDIDCEKIAALTAESAKYREALESIAKYGIDGICPYGCDTPNIAQAALQTEGGKRNGQ